MPKPQKIPEFSPEINLFQIPRKKAPGDEAPPPPPPPPATPSRPSASARDGGGGPRSDSQAKYWEEKMKEHASENLKLHQQLDSVTKHRDQLLGVISSQQQGGAVLEEAKAALEAEMVNARQLEQQLSHLQQRLQEFNGRLAEKDQEVSTARQRSAALEHQLTQSTADLARIRTELDTQAAEQATLLSELRGQLAEAKEAGERTETALRDQTARAREVSADLANLRLAHHDSQRQAEENRKATADLSKRNAELEQRLSDRTGEIQHLRSELDRRGTSYVDEFALRSRLKEELRHEYTSRLASEQEAATALRRQNLELQERLNEAVKEMDAVKRRSIDNADSEAVFAKQLHAAQAMADKAQTSYGKEAARANRLENTVETLKQTKEELQLKLSTERKEATKLKRKAEMLEKRLSSRKRGADIAGATGEMSDMDLRVRDSVSALAKATADLEAERRRLEGAALHSRMPSLDATRVGHAFVNSFRTQLRPSADNLMRSIRGLLEFSLDSEQKRLAQTALDSALVIQANLQEASLQTETGS